MSPPRVLTPKAAALCLILVGCSETRPVDFNPWESSDLICVDQKTGYSIGRDRATGQYTYWERTDWSSREGIATPQFAKAACPGLIP